jgi:hypothetical protein
MRLKTEISTEIFPVTKLNGRKIKQYRLVIPVPSREPLDRSGLFSEYISTTSRSNSEYFKQQLWLLMARHGYTCRSNCSL